MCGLDRCHHITHEVVQYLKEVIICLRSSLQSTGRERRLHPLQCRAALIQEGTATCSAVATGPLLRSPTESLSLPLTAWRHQPAVVTVRWGGPDVRPLRQRTSRPLELAFRFPPGCCLLCGDPSVLARHPCRPPSPEALLTWCRKCFAPCPCPLCHPPLPGPPSHCCSGASPGRRGSGAPGSGCGPQVWGWCPAACTSSAPPAPNAARPVRQACDSRYLQRTMAWRCRLKGQPQR